MSVTKDSNTAKSSETGLRYNEGKMRYSLVSLHALKELVHILEGGAVKYAPWNWANGLSWTDTYDSLRRHLEKWMMGEERDHESGRLHLGHVFCNAMFLLHFAITKTGTDDRPVAHREEAVEPTIKEYAGSSSGCGAYNPVEFGRVSNLQENVRPTVAIHDGFGTIVRCEPDGGVAGYYPKGDRSHRQSTWRRLFG
jgi:hypothetical protein